MASQVIEFLLKFYALLFRYFCFGWNLLDFFLVCLSVNDAWVMPFIGMEGGGMKSLSVLRMARMLRLARLIRLMRAFKELWLIVSGFIASLKTLSWVCMLLGIVLYLYGIFMTLMVGKNCGENAMFGDWENCAPMFGNVLESMWTMFQVITLT